MKLVDVHCHLESEHFRDNLDGIIADAAGAGIVKLITASITPDQWPRSLGLAKKYDGVECALGIHPWYIAAHDFDRIEELSQARAIGAVAIGEIGLDSKVSSPPFDMQIRFFESQLAVARDINLPVIMHCRGAFYELMVSLKKIGVPERGGIIHSFSGSGEIAEELIKFNISFSLGGILTYRNSKKRERMLKKIYPGRFLLETDSPDIPPVEKRGSVNVPSNILLNLRAAAEILGEKEENIAFATTQNASRILNLNI